MKFLRSNATAIFAVTAVLFIAGPLLANFHIVPSLAGFGIFALSVLMGLVCLVTSAAAIRAKQVQNGVMLLSMGVLPVIIVGYSLATSGSHPRINDVSTDLANPPVLIDQRHPEAPVILAPETAAVIREKYNDLAPVRSDNPPEVVFSIISDEIKTNKNWVVVKYDSENLAIHGYEQFGIFQFTDDFTIRVSSDGGDGSVVDMRSKSRNGKGDLGANARRIRGFLSSLSTKL